jgi:hypothetical protein
VYFLLNIYNFIYITMEENTRVRKTYKDNLSNIKYTELNNKVYSNDGGNGDGFED